MRSSQASKRRLAENAYLLDRALKNPASTEEFGRAAIDVLRLALRPMYAAIVCRCGSSVFHCGDSALAGDLDAAAELLRRAPRSLLSRPLTLRRSEAAAAGIPALERSMTASALELIYPIADEGVLLGVIAIGPRSDRSAWTADEVEFCDRVGARLSAVAAREALASEAANLRAAAASSERLASVGRMAAGLAHEIRNPLVSIRTFTQLLPERHADEEFRNGFLDLTLAEIDRITTLVGEILSFSRPRDAASDDESSTTDVAECVDRSCQLLRSHARSAGVALLFEAGELAQRGAIDEDKLRQVIINLVVNGIQACDGRGTVCVSVRGTEAGRIAITVEDNGRGMNEETAEQIFEPFFTTRAEGTGLGLALVKRMLDEAGATVSVVSAPGRGTRFTIELLAEGAAGLEAVRREMERRRVEEETQALLSELEPRAAVLEPVS